MNYLSLFSGIEAASVAWHPLGWTPLAFAEIEKFPSAVLAHRYPDVENLGDVTAVDWEAWREQNGTPDVLVAGAPCQAFSVAGNRLSLEDARGNLTLYTAELVRFLNPRFFLFENVPGILNTPDNAFGCLLGELVGAGEALRPAGGRWGDVGAVMGPEGRLAWRVLDAQWFGLAQRRRRVFLVRCPRDGDDPAAVLLEPRREGRHLAPSREPRAGLAADAGSGSPCVGFTPSQHARYVEGVGTMRAEGGDLGGGSETLCVTGDVTHALTSEGADASEDGTGRGTPIVLASGHANAEVGDDVATTLCARNAKDGPFVAQSESAGQPYKCGECGHFEVHADTPDRCPFCDGEHYANIAIDGPLAFTCKDHGADAGMIAPTLRAMQHAEAAPNGGGQVAVAEGYTVRRLTPTECERLQGFPDGWTAIPWRGKPASECPDGPRYRALGNSMAVACMSWLGRRIQEVSA